VGPHPPVSGGRERREFRAQAAVGVEQCLGTVAPHPLLEPSELRRIVSHFRERHLVCPEGALDRKTIDLARAGPSFRRAEHDSRPTDACTVTMRSRLTLE